MFEIHDLYCRRFLNRFEEAQEKMLRLDSAAASREFELLYDCFNRECKKGLDKITKSALKERDVILLSGQLNKICRYLIKFADINGTLAKDKMKPKEIITHFEEQHQFKKILIKHLTDLEKLTTQPV